MSGDSVSHCIEFLLNAWVNIECIVQYSFQFLHLSIFVMSDSKGTKENDYEIFSTTTELCIHI